MHQGTIGDTGSDPEPFTLPVYAAEHVLDDGYRPWVGDIVQGRLWLQGGMPKGQGAAAIISTGD